MLLACVLTMPFLNGFRIAKAQATINNPMDNEVTIGDTIVVNLKQNNKVLIIGGSIRKMKNF